MGFVGNNSCFDHHPSITGKDGARKIRGAANLRLDLALNAFGDWSLSILLCEQ
jgi:hypothetical protein